MKYKREIFLVTALIVSATLVFVGLYTFEEETVRSRRVVPPYDIFWCAEDADCMVVDQAGCCPCEEGGGQTAITRWHKDDLRRFVKKACRPWDKQVCVQIDTCSERTEARCEKRRCRLVHIND